MEFRTEDYVDPPARKDKFTANLMAGLKDEERKLIESTFGTNKEMEIDREKASKLV